MASRAQSDATKTHRSNARDRDIVALEEELADRLGTRVSILPGKKGAGRVVLDYSNLDDNPAFKGINTTTEYVAFHIHGLLAAACRDGRLGAGGKAVTGLKILLRESPNAWAAYEAAID